MDFNIPRWRVPSGNILHNDFTTATRSSTEFHRGARQLPQYQRHPKSKYTSAHQNPKWIWAKAKKNYHDDQCHRGADYRVNAGTGNAPGGGSQQAGYRGSDAAQKSLHLMVCAKAAKR